MPKWPLQSECILFYGDPTVSDWYARNVIEVFSPYALHVGGLETDHIHCHKKCADSLRIVLAEIWDKTGKRESEIRRLKYDIYDGCYNLRAKRGARSLSMHAFACAIDFAAEFNPWRSPKFLFQNDSIIVQAFKREGWIWGGDWQTKDAMHFQAARIR